MRPSGRKPDQLRAISFETGVSDYAEGSCLVTYGRTKVLCTASLEERPPVWLRNTGKGWVTAEYGMLPRSTHDRMPREAAKGKQGGRTVEIQRLIGRSLRSVVDLKGLNECQITVDCDVINADGGTRTASISGGFVALHMALKKMVGTHKINKLPISDFVAAVSCGLYNGVPVLDLDYAEDSNAAADANFVLTARGGIVEIQGTAEHNPFSEQQFTELFTLAKKGVAEIVELQKKALEGI